MASGQFHNHGGKTGTIAGSLLRRKCRFYQPSAISAPGAVQNKMLHVSLYFRQFKKLVCVKRLLVPKMDTAARATQRKQRRCFRRCKQLLAKTRAFAGVFFAGFSSFLFRKGLSLEGGLSELPECLFKRRSSSSTRDNKRNNKATTSSGVLSSASLLNGCGKPFVFHGHTLTRILDFFYTL